MPLPAVTHLAFPVKVAHSLHPFLCHVQRHLHNHRQTASWWTGIAAEKSGTAQGKARDAKKCCGQAAQSQNKNMDFCFHASNPGATTTKATCMWPNGAVSHGLAL